MYPSKLTISQGQVLAVLRAAPFFGFTGLTDEELVKRTTAMGAGSNLRPQSPSSVRSRRKELERLGLVSETGERRAGPSGRKMRVWVAKTQ